MKILLPFILMLSLAGCATSPRQGAGPSSATPMMASNTIRHMQLKIEAIEDQLNQKDQQIEALRYEMKELAYQVETLDLAGVVEPKLKTKTSFRTKKSPAVTNHKFKDILRVSVAPKQAQKALKNAGYYSGKIDGKLGAQTRKAIRAFQKDHGLKVDGVIGKNTWKEMKNYL